MMVPWSSYRALWPAFALIALIMWVIVLIKRNNDPEVVGWLVVGALLLTASTVVAYMRARREAQTPQ
jgi:hypothetical protein